MPSSVLRNPLMVSCFTTQLHNSVTRVDEFDDMDFMEAENSVYDLIAEYQQYQDTMGDGQEDDADGMKWE